MKWLIILTLALPFKSLAQGLQGTIAYEYLYAAQWDKAIRSYNFSRPFLEEKQPLLVHGGSVGGAYLFNRPKRLKFGIELSFSSFRSKASNGGLTNVIRAELIRAGLVLHYHDHKKAKGIFGELMIGPVMSTMSRAVDRERILLDDERLRTFGVGGEVAARVGYGFFTKKRLALAPFVSISFIPYLYDPRSEIVLNQTQGLVSERSTIALSAQLGMHFKVLPKQKALGSGILGMPPNITTPKAAPSDRLLP